MCTGTCEGCVLEYVKDVFWNIWRMCSGTCEGCVLEHVKDVFWNM
jgi:hypothetical protein